MVIDIFFILMAAFGFYFGFTFGLMKVVVMVVSVSVAALASMRFTPMTTDLIAETFDVDSPFLPFLAFLVTLIVVLMMARMAAKLLEETVDSKRFDMISQVIGGLMMGLFFTLLYSVLVTFFGQAHVLDLVFNKDIYTTKENEGVRLLSINPIDLRPAPITMVQNESSLLYIKKGTVSFSQDYVDGKFIPSINGIKHSKAMLRQDTFAFNSNYEIQITENDQLVCFCDSTFIIYAQGDTINFYCMDEYLSSKSMTSFFYKYIELIPKRGTIFLKEMLPFVNHFVEYMSVALERLERGNRRPQRPINVLSTEEENEVTPGLLEEEDVFDNEEEEKPVEENNPPPPDSLFISIDTTGMPTVTPEEEDEEPEDVEYEG